MVEQDIKVPELGINGKLDVIEVMVKPGDQITIDTPLITLESEKASMEVPASAAGIVKTILLKIGDQVASGDIILTLVSEAIEAVPSAEKTAILPTEPVIATTLELPTPISPTVSNDSTIIPDQGWQASPLVRRLARELEIDLTKIDGTGPKGRIQKQDLHAYIKMAMQKPTTSLLAPLPPIDHAAFGAIEIQPLTKIRRFSGANLHRNWLHVPHVTQFDEADITDLEAFRRSKQSETEKLGYRLTSLAFIMKATVGALQRFPEMNASLDPQGEHLILKKYYHIGVAVDTPNGLVVPVIRNVDQKSLLELAQELAAISDKARTKGLTPAEMQGSSFSISSLGGIGGTAFTPIVNLPDVAILGVSRATLKPVYQNGEFVPRLMLPLSLSYDHRVIDGAQGARFTTYLCQLLADLRNLLL